MNYKIQITEHYVNCVRVHDITTPNNSITINPTQPNYKLSSGKEIILTKERSHANPNTRTSDRQVNSII